MDNQIPSDDLYPQQDDDSNYDEPIERKGQVQPATRSPVKSVQSLRSGRSRKSKFTDRKIRNAFVRKVYSILTIQMVIVAIIVVLIYNITYFREFFQQTLVFIGVIAFCVIILITMCCCVKIARVTPLNYLFLFAFTVTMGLILSLIAILYRIDIILLAVGIIALICFCVTVFAFQTSIDFTGYGPYICLIFMIFFVVIIDFSVFKPDNPVSILFAVFGVVIISLRLISDTQKMLGGKHRYSFSPEDYVFAALALFFNIVFIFSEVFRAIRNAADGDREGDR